MKSLIKTLIFILPSFLFGQLKTYIGIEYGPKYDTYQITDFGNTIKSHPQQFRKFFGIFIEQEINQNFSIEIGYLKNEYGEGYKYKHNLMNGGVAWNGIEAYQFPIRLKSHLNLYNNKFNIISIIGFTYSKNNSYDSYGEGNSIFGFGNYNFETKKYNYYNFKKNFGLLETGIGLEFKTKKSFEFSISYHNFTGFTKVSETALDYRFDDDPTWHSASIFSNGDFYTFVFGLKYPISNLWTKKSKKSSNYEFENENKSFHRRIKV